MEKTEEEMHEIEEETKPLLEEAEQNANRRFTSTLDKIMIGLSFAMGLDSIAVPIFTGFTIHEYLGIPPKSNYQIYPGVTALIVEQGIWTLSMFYNTAMALYKKE